MNRKVFGVGASWLAALFLTFGVSTAMIGCDGGADQTTGTQAKPDESAAKRQNEMADFYKQNPLNKSKSKAKSKK